MNKYLGYLAAIIILSGCSKDDYSILEDNLIQKEYTNVKTSDFTQPISYEIINDDNKIIGEITFTEYSGMLKTSIKTSKKHPITSIQLYAGSFKEVLDYQKFPFQVQLAKPQEKYSLLIEKQPLEFDKNNCIFISCHIQVLNTETQETESVWAQSRALPGFNGVKTLLFCSQINL